MMFFRMVLSGALALLIFVASVSAAATSLPTTTQAVKGTASAKDTIDPKGLAVLKEMFDVYRSAQSYQDEVTLSVSMKVKGQEKSQSFDAKLAVQRPGKIVYVWPSVSLSCDGNCAQVLYPQLGQYIKQKSPEKLTLGYLETLLEDKFRTVVINGLFSDQPFEELIKPFDKLTYLGIEKTDGRSYHHFRYQDGSKWVEMFVDQDQKVVRKLRVSPMETTEQSWTLTILFKLVKLNKPIDEKVFEIAKPTDAREVKRISYTREFDYARQGDKIPDFKIEVLAGVKGSSKASLKTLLGSKLTFVTFWATWCPPCRAELPVLEELYKIYHEQGVNIVGVNVDTDVSNGEIQSMVADMGLGYVILRDKDGRCARELLVQSLPTLLILDDEGRIMEAHVGTSPNVREELIAVIEGVLAKSANKK